MGTPIKSSASSVPRTVLAGTIGNVLEWYDFAIYGFLAPIIGNLFFPSDDSFASLLAAFGVLAVGYAARPVGSVLFGTIGDKLGRKPALVLSVILMGVSTCAIGLLPDHSQIGEAAPVLLILLRSLQGVSVAGEYADSTVLLGEQAPLDRRGYILSWVAFASNGGFLLGAGVGAVVSSLLGDQAMHAWGWRIPFLLGAVVAGIAVFVRRGLVESPVMNEIADGDSSPVIVALRRDWRLIVRIVFLVMPTAIGYYIFFVFAASYLTDQMHFSTAEALNISSVNLLVMVSIAPFAGIYADRLGRKPLLWFVAVGTFALAWPLWWLMHQNNLGIILAGQLGFAVLNGIGWVVIMPAMVEMLPAKTRCTTLAIGYNLCLGFIGGTTPLVATYLVERTANDFSPVYYLMAASLLSFIAIKGLREGAQRPLL